MATDEQFEADSLQFQQIKNRVDSYEERRNKVVANNYEFLRSQVEPGYTPKYVSGSYIKPDVAINHNTIFDDSDGYWRMWFLNLETAQSTVDVSVTVTLSNESIETLTSTGLDASAAYTDFIDSFIGGLSSSTVITSQRHCDTCVRFDVVEGSEIEITNITASID
jgi:hypothetical protein